MVLGTFSIVWGLCNSCGLLQMLFINIKTKATAFLFCGRHSPLVALYEYFVQRFYGDSFGKVFWDYSDIPFNLGGRINLLYCFFWGIAAVVWFKKLYPYISRAIELLPMLWGKIVTWILIIFMVINCGVSSLALIRYDERDRGISATSQWAEGYG